MTERRRALLLVAGLAALLMGAARVAAQYPPSPDEYVAHVGGEAQVIPAGKLTLGQIGERSAGLSARKLDCGHRPTVLDGRLDDYGAAYPGFLILNPKLLGKVSTPVRMWIFAHECGHQFRGPNEEDADCFAVQRGRRYGWLTPDGLEEVCRFISPAKGDMMHFSGSHRCESMRRCYADPSVR